MLAFIQKAELQVSVSMRKPVTIREEGEGEGMRGGGGGCNEGRRQIAWGYLVLGLGRQTDLTD